jgi:hypothetical protein
MAFNLIRDSRVFFTTNVNSYGVVGTSGFLSGAYGTGNTWEIQVQDGFSFSQNTTTETVTLSEAGATPNRGQRNFNTGLDATDFSFSTYIRPNRLGVVAGTGGTSGAAGYVTAEEGLLWNAMFGTNPIAAPGTTSGTLGAWNTGSTSAVVDVTASNKHQLQKFGMIIALGATTYVIDNCVMDSATIDFGIDAIASVAWAGKGASLRQLTNAVALTTNTTSGVVTFGTSGSLVGTANWKNITAPYLANKLSTVSFDTGIGFGTSGATVYNVALTGGSLTFANNVTYLTPANLGVVNQPITYFTGTRAISGTMNAYLRTGGGQTADLLKALLDDKTTVSPEFSMTLSIGGSSTAATRVDVGMPAVMLAIPTISTDQVVSTTIAFTAQGSTGTSFDIEAVNEATVTYVAP